MMDILEPVNIIGLSQKFAEALDLPLSAYFPRIGSPVPGATVTYDVVTYSRDIAELNTRDGAPNPVAQVKRGTVTLRAPSIAEQVTIPAHTVANLRAPGELAQKNGEQWVARNIQNLTRRLERRIELLRAQALGADPTRPGCLRFREPGLEEDTVVELGYRDDHLQLHTADWSDPDADIIGDIEAGIAKIAEDGGKVADTLIVGSRVMSYLRQNAGVQALLTDAERAQLLLGTGLLRLVDTNVRVVRGVYDDNGTLRPFIPENGVILLAGDNSDRMLIECSPTSLHAPEGTRGLFVHRIDGEGLRDGITIQYEWTGCPVVMNPDEIIADGDVTSA